MKTLVTCLAALILIGSHNLQAEIVISEVNFQSNVVEIFNNGPSDVDISTWWICNRVNGSPFYYTIANATSINPASTEASGVADLILEAGDVLVLDVTAGFLPPANGEFAFYNSNSFGSSAAIEEYIAWGGDGFRDNVADGAGLWTTGDFIDVTGLSAGDSLQLIPGASSASSSDYVFGAPSFGAIPEPSSAIVLGLVSTALLVRRRK